MAVTLLSVTEVADGRQYSVAEDGSRKYQKKYTVVLDTSAATTAEANGIESYVEYVLPFSRYQAHGACPYAYCRAIDCKQLSNVGTHNTVWEVTAVWSSMKAEAATADISSTPGDSERPSKQQDQDTPADQRLPQIKFSRKERRKVLEKDAASGAAITNSAGDPYDPPLEVDRSNLVINLTYWKLPSATPFSSIQQYFNTLNQSSLTVLGVTYPPKTLKMVDLGLTLVWDNSSAGGGQASLFVEHNMQLEVAPYEYGAQQTWDVTVLNAGKRELKSGKLVPVNDKQTGQPVHQPVPLKSDGTQCGPTDTKVYNTHTGWVALDWKIGRA